MYPHDISSRCILMMYPHDVSSVGRSVSQSALTLSKILTVNMYDARNPTVPIAKLRHQTISSEYPR